MKTVNIPFAEAFAIWTRPSVKISERIYEIYALFLMTHQKIENVNRKSAHISNLSLSTGSPVVSESFNDQLT